MRNRDWFWVFSTGFAVVVGICLVGWVIAR
jgi:hypothetical protein